MDTLVDPEGNILIPGITDDVVPVTEPEEKLYNSLDFDVDDFHQDSGITNLRTEEKGPLLMNRWRFPSLSIHGIQGTFHQPGAKTVIPRKVIGKFSITLVPNMTTEKVTTQVIRYINGIWKKRGSPNSMVVYMTDDGCPPWTSNPLHPNYKAARRAIAMVYGFFPDLIRDGGTNPNVIHLQETTKKNVLLLPMGSCDDNPHARNEKLDARNYIEGTKVMAAYIWECGKVNGPVVP